MKSSIFICQLSNQNQKKLNPVIDIRNKEVLSQFNKFDKMEIEIYEDEIQDTLNLISEEIKELKIRKD